MGDATSPDTWGSIPFHFLQYGQAAGFIDEGLPLNPYATSIKIKQKLWRVAVAARTRCKPWGFQHSGTMQDALWKPWRLRVRGHRIINMFNRFPRWLLNDPASQTWHYVDGNMLADSHYASVPHSGRHFKRMVAREREGYQAATGLIAFSSFTAQSFVTDYGIDPARVHVVVPGANILPAHYQQWEQETVPALLEAKANQDHPLKLLIIGREFKRKGVDRILNAMRIGQQRGLKATLRVVGLRASDVPSGYEDVRNVEWCGLISRRDRPMEFFRLISECDIGVLLSRVEYSAIALREYLALGMPVIGPNTGGCLDLMDAESSINFKPNDPPDAIAETLLDLENDRDLFARMQRRAMEVRRSALWTVSVNKIRMIMDSKTANPAPAFS